MSLSTKQEEMKGVSFFESLRHLGRKLDQEVKEIENRLDASNLQSYDNTHLGLNALLNHKKDVNSLKTRSRKLLNELRHRDGEFEKFLHASSDTIDVLQKQLNDIQDYLMPYGFVQQQEADEPSETVVSDTEKPPDTPTKQIAERKEMEKKCKLTPCLEDYGLSSYTLSMLNQLSQKIHLTVPCAELLQRGKLQARQSSVRQDSVPSPFQNSGLVVTPSLFSTNHCISTWTNKTGQEILSLSCTPDLKASGREHTAYQECADCSLTVLAKALDFTESPAPPVLQTPGAKQISNFRSAIVSTEEVKGNAAKQMKENIDSPIPPVLSTPGFQQISKGSVVEKKKTTVTSQTVGYNSADIGKLELPKTPELTFNYKVLEDVTSSFNEKLTVASSDLKTEALTQEGKFRRPLTDSDLNLPPPPKLMGNYHFRSVTD